MFKFLFSSGATPGASLEALADYISNQLVRHSQLSIEDNGVVHDRQTGVMGYSTCILQHLLQSEFEKKSLWTYLLRTTRSQGLSPNGL